MITPWYWDSCYIIMVGVIWYIQRHYSSLMSWWLLLETSLLLMTSLGNRSAWKDAACVVAGVSVHEFIIRGYVSCTELVIHVFGSLHHSNSSTSVALSTHSQLLVNLKTIFEHRPSVWLLAVTLAFASALVATIPCFSEILQFPCVGWKLLVQTNCILFYRPVALYLMHLVVPFTSWSSHSCTLINDLRCSLSYNCRSLHEVIHIHLHLYCYSSKRR